MGTPELIVAVARRLLGQDLAAVDLMVITSGGVSRDTASRMSTTRKPGTYARRREGRWRFNCRARPHPIGAEPLTCSRRERPAAPPQDLVVGERGSGPAPAEL